MNERLGKILDSLQTDHDEQLHAKRGPNAGHAKWCAEEPCRNAVLIEHLELFLGRKAENTIDRMTREAESRLDKFRKEKASLERQLANAGNNA